MSQTDTMRYWYSTAQLRTAFIDMYNPMAHLESIIVKATWYGKRADPPRHEFILIQVEKETGGLNGLVNYIVLDRNVSSKPGGPLQRFGQLRRFMRGEPACDTFKVACAGNWKELLSDCNLESYSFIEHLEFSSEHVLHLYELVVLAHVVSTRYPTHRAIGSNPCLFVRLTWDTLRHLYPAANFRISGEDRGRSVWIRHTIYKSQVQEIGEQASREITEAKSRIELSRTTPSTPDPVDSQEKLRITAETSPEDIINYFVQVAKLDNYTSKLDCGQPLDQRGRGGCADVYRVATTSGAYVAVKCIFTYHHSGNAKTLKRTARELEVWSKLKNTNILPLLGLAQFSNCVAMVSSWMDEGNVVNYVNNRPETDRYRLSVKIVRAVAYLHSQVPEIVGDAVGTRSSVANADASTQRRYMAILKGHDNILISPDGSPQLTDFGLAIMVESNLIMSATGAGVGTIRWMAPELFRKSDRSKESDVYALGMTILEVLTGKWPFDEIDYTLEVQSAVLLDRLTPQRPKELSSPSKLNESFWEAMTKCWAYEKDLRATVAEVEKLMEGALED